MNWRQEYLERLNAPNPSDDEIKAAFDLKNSYLPSHLYKYREPNEYAISGLLKDAVWVCSPKQYSDVNEFTEKVDAVQYRKALDDALNKELALAVKGKSSLPIEVTNAVKKGRRRMKIIGLLLPKRIKNKLLSVGDKVLGDKIVEIHQLLVEDIQTKMRVCSFCEVPDSIDMWRDYASQNTGFCIEFNIGRWRLDEIRRTLLHPVVYTDELYDSTHHHLQAMNGRFNPFYLILSGTRKQRKYEYENEWRFIIQAGASFAEQEFIMNCQSKVFLGAAMEEEYKRKVIDICKSKHILIFQALPLLVDGKVQFEKLVI